MREEAMKWWNELPREEKETICKDNVDYLLCERNPDGLTGREIEHLYLQNNVYAFEFGND